MFFSRLLVGGAAGGGLPDVDRPRSAIRLLEPPPAGHWILKTDTDLAIH